MNYPDFTLSKPVPRLPPTPRINCNIGIIEIKTQSNSEAQDVERGYLSVDEAVLQAVGYARRLTTTFSLQDQNLHSIATYVVYGRFYTRVTMANTLIYEADDWQFVFEDFVLNEYIRMMD